MFVLTSFIRYNIRNSVVDMSLCNEPLFILRRINKEIETGE